MMQRSLEPTRPLARVKGVVCSKKEKKVTTKAEEKQKRGLTGPTLLEMSGNPTRYDMPRAKVYGRSTSTA